MMKRPWLRKLIGITGIIILFLLVAFFALLNNFTTPKEDSEIIELFEEEVYQPVISYLDFEEHRVRIISMQEQLDMNLPTLVFIHGSPGSAMDFKRYLKDEELNQRANIIAYDRVGYSDLDTGIILASVDEEVTLLHEVLKKTGSKNTILVGYSYGGTVAMASPKSFRRKIALAAAVRGELEPIFWVLKLCDWPLTRPMVPKVLRAAAEEKIRHVKELDAYDDTWNLSDAKVLSIHGEKDNIVPYQNSLYLAEKLGDKFKLVTLEKGNHSLIWTDFDVIRENILKSLTE